MARLHNLPQTHRPIQGGRDLTRYQVQTLSQRRINSVLRWIAQNIAHVDFEHTEGDRH